MTFGWRANAADVRQRKARSSFMAGGGHENDRAGSFLMERLVGSV